MPLSRLASRKAVLPLASVVGAFLLLWLVFWTAMQWQLNEDDKRIDAVLPDDTIKSSASHAAIVTGVGLAGITGVAVFVGLLARVMSGMDALQQYAPWSFLYAEHPLRTTQFKVYASLLALGVGFAMVYAALQWQLKEDKKTQDNLPDNTLVGALVIGTVWAAILALVARLAYSSAMRKKGGPRSLA